MSDRTGQPHYPPWLPPWIAAGILFLLFAASASALSGADMQGIFTEGNQKFQEANERVATNRESANELYRMAIVRWERIVREGGIENGKLYYNIGNAYFRLEELGPAILNYSRAGKYIPNDRNLAQNLEYARSRRLDRFDSTQSRRVLQTLFFWHYDIPSRARSAFFLVSFLVLWGAATARLFLRRWGLTRTLLISGGVAVVLLASLLIEAGAGSKRRPGVVVAPEVIARKGDSTSYAPSFTEPLHAGTEFDLLEERSDWSHVKLPDARQCWLPAHTTQLVN